MFNEKDVYKDDTSELFICTFITLSEEHAKKYCHERESMIRGLAGPVQLRNEGKTVILSTPNRNLTTHVAKLLNGYVKGIF